MRSPAPAEGFLVVDKPGGISSFDVLRRLRRSFGLRDAGHTGTLDPLATGVLGVGWGWATRLFPFLDDDPKIYRAEARLGQETDTDDADGEVTVERPVAVDAEHLAAALEAFTGATEQLPPAYSAKKVAGVTAYRRARRGEEVVLRPQVVRIDALELEAFASPRLALRVVCGRGTYVRALVRDLGRALGCGAHLTALRRLASGPFRIEEALRLDDLEARAERGEPLPALPLLGPLGTLARFDLDAAGYDDIAHGRCPRLPDGLDWPEGRKVAAVSPSGELAAVAVVTTRDEGTRVLRPLRVRPFATA